MAFTHTIIVWTVLFFSIFVSTIFRFCLLVLVSLLFRSYHTSFCVFAMLLCINRSLNLKKREIEQQASTEWMNDRAKDVIDIDDNIPFSVNNDSTNSSSYVGTDTMNASSSTTTTATAAADMNDGRFLFESTSLKTETIVLLLMFGMCTIIYCSKYFIFLTFKQQVALCEWASGWQRKRETLKHSIGADDGIAIEM